jgi:DNA-binding IclR family transcriptional regulator
MSLAPAADAVLQILVLLARQAEPVPAAQIGAMIGLPRSTTYRLLGVLTEHGFVSYLPEERRYGLGVVAFELGSSYSRQMPLRRIAQPVLTRLVRTTRQNAHLAVLYGVDVFYVIEERAPGRPPLVTDVGVRLPAALTASGLAILSSLPPAQVKAIYSSAVGLLQPDGRPVSLRELRRSLTDVRNRGYAIEESQVTEGLASVGVPVLDHTGHPVAGISVTFEADRVDGDEHAQLISAVRLAAHALSRRLGA